MRLLSATLPMLVLLLAACGGSASAPTPPPNGSATSTAQPTAPAQRPRLNGIELNTLDPALLDRLLVDASDYQRALLEDGDLTLEEYEQAMLDKITCLREQGFEIDESRARLNGIYDYLYTSRRPGGVPEETKAIARDCESEYASVLRMAWSVVTQPVVDDVAQRSRAYALDCLEAKGFTLDQRPWDSDDPEAEAAYQGCVQETQRVFDLGYLFFGFEGEEQYRE